jgi:hypothetical protein
MAGNGISAYLLPVHKFIGGHVDAALHFIGQAVSQQAVVRQMGDVMHHPRGRLPDLPAGAFAHDNVKHTRLQPAPTHATRTSGQVHVNGRHAVPGDLVLAEDMGANHIDVAPRVTHGQPDGYGNPTGVQDKPILLMAGLVPALNRLKTALRIFAQYVIFAEQWQRRGQARTLVAD